MVKKAEELNLSIDSVRGKIAELGSDRNRKRKSSVPTRLIFKTNDDPVDSQYFAKGMKTLKTRILTLELNNTF